jgi:hypothetical protein
MGHATNRILDATSTEPNSPFLPLAFCAFAVGVLRLIGEYVLDPPADSLDKRAIFNYRPRLGLKRDRRRQAFTAHWQAGILPETTSVAYPSAIVM